MILLLFDHILCGKASPPYLCDPLKSSLKILNWIKYFLKRFKKGLPVENTSRVLLIIHR
jgi:hypothetical protein